MLTNVGNRGWGGGGDRKGLVGHWRRRKMSRTRQDMAFTVTCEPGTPLPNGSKLHLHIAQTASISHHVGTFSLCDRFKVNPLID